MSVPEDNPIVRVQFALRDVIDVVKYQATVIQQQQAEIEAAYDLGFADGLAAQD